jgi:hypothetical protein
MLGRLARHVRHAQVCTGIVKVNVEPAPTWL